MDKLIISADINQYEAIKGKLVSKTRREDGRVGVVFESVSGATFPAIQISTEFDRYPISVYNDYKFKRETGEIVMELARPGGISEGTTFWALVEFSCR